MDKYSLKSSDSTTSDQEWLNQIDQLYLANLNDLQFKVTQLARATFLSERQFYRKIKKLTGKTPSKYLQLLRLKEAQRLLESGKYDTVKAVALSVGYSRADYFSRVYEKHYGKRPIEYLPEKF